MRLVVVVVAVALISGCVEEPEPVEQTTPATEDEEAEVMESDETLAQTESFVLNWTGELVRGGWVCQAQAGCHAAPSDGAYSADASYDLPTGNFSGPSIVLEWSSTSEVTRELVVGYRIASPGCDGCRTDSRETTGTSPLEVLLPDPIEVTQPATLQLWVYGAMVLGEDNSMTYAGASDEQAFALGFEATREYSV